MKIRKVTWTEVNLLCQVLAKKIEPFKQDFTAIYGVPRGGLIPAVILSNLTGLPMYFSQNSLDKKVLVVDDIIDTGRTAEKIIEKGGITFATLFINPSSSIKSSFYGSIHDAKQWIIFPWETSTSSKYDYTI